MKKVSAQAKISSPFFLNHNEISVLAEKRGHLGRKVHLGIRNDLFSMKDDGGVGCQPGLKFVM